MVKRLRNNKKIFTTPRQPPIPGEFDTEEPPDDGGQPPTQQEAVRDVRTSENVVGSPVVRGVDVEGAIEEDKTQETVDHGSPNPQATPQATEAAKKVVVSGRIVGENDDSESPMTPLTDRPSRSMTFETPGGLTNTPSGRPRRTLENELTDAREKEDHSSSESTQGMARKRNRRGHGSSGNESEGESPTLFPDAYREYETQYGPFNLLRERLRRAAKVFREGVIQMDEYNRLYLDICQQAEDCYQRVHLHKKEIRAGKRPDLGSPTPTVLRNDNKKDSVPRDQDDVSEGDEMRQAIEESICTYRKEHQKETGQRSNTRLSPPTERATAEPQKQ
jgi:hypothetical protein